MYSATYVISNYVQIYIKYVLNRGSTVDVINLKVINDFQSAFRHHRVTHDLRPHPLSMEHFTLSFSPPRRVLCAVDVGQPSLFKCSSHLN